MPPSLHLPRKELRPSLKRAEDGSTAPTWDLYLDGRLVADEYASHDEALRELDLVAWYALFGEAPLSPSTPISDEALGLALAVFNRLFTSLTIQEKARTALEKIIRPRIYTVQPDRSLSVLASSSRGRQTAYAVKTSKTPRDDDQESYTVTMACACKDFYARAHTHGGVCKHVAAKLLLFLAQQGVAYLKHLRDALDQSDAIPQEVAPPHANNDPIVADAIAERAGAFLTISASHLAAALFLVVHDSSAIEVRAERGALRLVAGPITLTFPGLDGDGIAAVRLDIDVLAHLYEQLRPVAKRTGALNAFIEPDGSLFVCGQDDGDFAIEMHGEPLPTVAPAAGPDQQVATVAPAPPTPESDRPAVAALFALFTLLETHEPDWYVRKHDRLAHAALTAAGRLDSQPPR